MNLLGRTAALVVSALLLAGCGDQTSSRSAADDPTATPSPTVPSSTPSASPSDPAASTSSPAAPTGPVILTLDGIASGAPPTVPFLAADNGGWSLVRPGGDVQPLPRPYDAFAPMGDGLVGTASDDDETKSYVLDGNLEVVSEGTNPGGSLAVTPDGAIVGWLSADGRPHVVERGGSQEWNLPVVEGAGSLAALISDGDTCKEGEGGNGCAAFVNSLDGTRAWSAISHGIVEQVPGILAVGDVTEDGHMVALTSIADEGSCWGRFAVWKKKPLWETCDHTLFDFSPSGERILAGPAYLDGFGQGSATVLDDDGRVVAEWRSEGHATLLHTVWEDDDHVLAMVFEDEAWAVLRLGVADGSVELAVAPVPEQGGQYPFVLPSR